MFQGSFWWTALLAAGFAGVLAPRSDAQISRARRSVVKVEVMDEGLREALKLRKSTLPAKEMDEKLAKISIQQQFRLLVSGVAIAPHEIVTPALHPTARLRIVLTLYDGSKHRGALVGTDPRTNLALVRSPVALQYYLEPYVETIRKHQVVELIGHSMVDPMKAAGFVTQLRIATEVRDIYGIHTEDKIPLGAVFVVAAPTVPCNPGTACLNGNGRLIGIVLGCAPAQVMVRAKGGPAARFERSFIVPSRRILKVVHALRTHGRVIRADFGLALAPVSHALRAQLEGLPSCAATIGQLKKDGPAARSGVHNDDILLAVNGKQPEDIHLLREALTDCPLDKPATLTVLRAGKKIELVVKPIEQK